MRPAATAGSVSPVTTMQLRTIEQPRPELPPVVEFASPAAMAAPERVGRVDREAPRHDAAPPDTAAVEPEPNVEPSARVVSVPGWSLPGMADEDDLFLARSFLAVPPTPMAPVIITYPDFVGIAARYSGELILFIDETGAVVRVHVESGVLPPALEEAARHAFMSVRFRPGELAERGAVKSRIRVEVIFEGGAPQQLG